ncbi:DNA-processing protein DprA [Maribellus sp. CM-23]|uniref:DNA-processing protein DprA n=1 Tax=Maribellus sp. CM-23 TaxID=2781026 RepID=UPI001F2E1503|nr:DNA-processing protein DprA [Maribellus sp. CM-23]MCE4566042.1 DNA-processing protein DprA [Maribellus sp. CM-23]
MNVLDTLILLNLPKVGRKTVKKIIDLELPEQNQKELIDYIRMVSLVAPKISESITDEDVKMSFDLSNDILLKSEKKGIRTIGYSDIIYPKLLKELDNDAPVVLFVKGDEKVLANEKKIAVIGTRENSPNGEIAGKIITKQFVERGYIIVSGLAIGCDTLGHKVALESGGKTIAVMAGGLDKIYPKENSYLAEKILENGCLISEYPIGTSMRPNFFVERDRIQSGLSQGVVVIETNVKGGTLHTVKFATDQKRAVACIKYNDDKISPSNAGNRMLISNGRAFPLSSNNINEFIENILQNRGNIELQSNIESSKTVNVEKRYSPEKKSSNTTVQSEALNSNPDVKKQIDENVLKIAKIKKDIEKLNKDIIKYGGDANGQTSMFDNSINEVSYRIESLKREIELLESQKRNIVNENKELLKSISNTK